MAWTPELQAEYNALRAQGLSDLNIAEAYGVNPVDVANIFGAGYVPTNAVTGQAISQPAPTPVATPTPTTATQGISGLLSGNLTSQQLNTLLGNVAINFDPSLGAAGLTTGQALSDWRARGGTDINELMPLIDENKALTMTVPVDLGNGKYAMVAIDRDPVSGGYTTKQIGMGDGTKLTGTAQDLATTAQRDTRNPLLEALPQLAAAGIVAGGLSGLLDPYTVGSAGAGAGSSAGLPVFDAGMGAFINPATGGAMLEADALAALQAATAAGTLTPEAAAGMVNFANTTGANPALLFSGMTASQAGLLGGAGGAVVGGTPVVGGAAGAAGAGSALGSAATTAGATGAGSALGGLFSGLPAGMGSALVGGAANLIGMGLQNQTNRDIANQNADLIRQANEDKRFRPVGVTTRFGQSQFGYDPSGRLISAGYTLAPDVKMLQDRQIGMIGGLQGDWERAVQLGRGAMKTPQEFIAEQQGLLQPERERALAEIRNRAQQTGRSGLATMGTSTTMATNPELAAYYNAIQQENARLAANAPQQSLALASQGLGLMSEGYRPVQTAVGAVTGLEQLGQQTMDLGTSLGAQASTAGARLQTPQMPNQVNPWAAGLMGGVNAYQQYQARQPVTTQNPYVPQQTYSNAPYANAPLEYTVNPSEWNPAWSF